MKIISLQAENIKKLVAVEIRPDGNIVEITGKNRQGKTSILDSIWWCLAGASNIQAAPIRNGETQARIRLDMGEIVATRTFRSTKDGEFTSSISVENENGSKISSPQAMLDGLFGQLSFDPQAFCRSAPREQFEMLRKFVPTLDFDAIEAKKKESYSRRTEVNRKLKEVRAMASGLVIPDGLPAETIDQSGLIDKLEKAASHNADIETRKANRVRMRQDVEKKRKEAEDLNFQIAQIRDKMGKLVKEADDLQAKLDSAPPLPNPVDVTVLREEIDAAKDINDKISLRCERDSYLSVAQELEDESKAITEDMAKREAEVNAVIAAAKIPVPGLSFGEGEILLRGVPFNQGSDAEQLQAAVSMAMALNPKLKVIRVRDGSLMDDEAMKLLGEMAVKHDYQVWIERVDNSGKVGFVIEDGHLKRNLQEGDGE